MVVMEEVIMTKVTRMRRSHSRPTGRASGKALELQLKKYRLSTVEIIYHMPDHPSLLQTFYLAVYGSGAGLSGDSKVPRFLAPESGRRASFGAGDEQRHHRPRPNRQGVALVHAALTIFAFWNPARHITDL
jgi:hypothetical protein